MHAGRHKQDGPDVPVEVDPRNNLYEGLVQMCPNLVHSSSEIKYTSILGPLGVIKVLKPELKMPPLRKQDHESVTPNL